MGYKCKEGAGPAPPASNALNTNTFQMPQMPPSSIKDHILETRGRLNKICTGKKKSHSFRISKMGFLCRLLDDGNKMEVIDVMGDAISDQKMILSEKSTSLKASCFKDPGTFSKEDWVQWRVSRSFQIPRVWFSYLFTLQSHHMGW